MCRNAQLSITINCETWTLSDLIEKVLKKRLSFNSPIINIGPSEIYLEGEDGEEYLVNLSKTLANCPAGGIKEGTSITVEDDMQNLEVVINFTHLGADEWDEEKTPDMFVLGGTLVQLPDHQHWPQRDIPRGRGRRGVPGQPEQNAGQLPGGRDQGGNEHHRRGRHAELGGRH